MHRRMADLRALDDWALPIGIRTKINCVCYLVWLLLASAKVGTLETGLPDDLVHYMMPGELMGSIATRLYFPPTLDDVQGVMGVGEREKER